MPRSLRFIVSGGGTGGHIFPAIAIADELKRLHPDAEFLFVGARGRMEMEKVPAAGYRIEGLWISGLQRRLTLTNLTFPVKVLSSLFRAREIINAFRPDAVIGTGGYAGAPVLYAAARMNIPTLIQEPNAYAGLANKWLGKRVDKICVAFAGMGKFFPAHKLIITGNPVREQLLNRALSPAESPAPSSAESPKGARRPSKDDTAGARRPSGDDNPNILLMGGSGGARSLNAAMAASTEAIRARPRVRWTWQCGKAYFDQYSTTETARLPNVTITAFLDRMDEAYAAADVVIGRAGSTTIAEIEYLGKATILVPSPWVAENHQLRNAEALTREDAALLVPDAEVERQLVSTALGLIDDDDRRRTLGENARRLAKPGAVTRIAEEVLDLISSPSPQNELRATV